VPLPFLQLLAQEESATGLREWIDSAARTPLSEVVILISILSLVRIAMFPMLARTPVHKRGLGYVIGRFFNEVLDAVIYAGVFVFLIIRPFGIQAFLIPSGSMWPTLYVNDFIVANKAIYRYTDPKHGDVVVFRPPVEATFQNQRDENGDVKVDFIKRLIGTPGDVIELRNGVLYRNGRIAPDPSKHYSLTSDNVNYQEEPEDQVRQSVLASFKFIKWHGQTIPCNYTASEANSSTDGPGNPPCYQVAPKYVIGPADQAAALKAPPAPIPPGYYFFMGDNRNNSFDGRGWGLVKRDAIIGPGEYIWLPLNRNGRNH